MPRTSPPTGTRDPDVTAEPEAATDVNAEWDAAEADPDAATSVRD